MSTFDPVEVTAMLSAAGLDPEDWDTVELSGMLGAQWDQIDSVRDRLTQTDEPALGFDARWD